MTINNLRAPSMLTIHHHHEKSTRTNATCGSAKILNIARSAGPRWILGVLNPQEINFLAKFALHGIFAKIMIFHENLKFHHQVSNLVSIQTLHQKFFRSSRVQNLNPHNQISDWTEGNWKRLTGFCAQTKNVKFSNKKKVGPNLDPSGSHHHRTIFLSKTEASF